MEGLMSSCSIGRRSIAGTEFSRPVSGHSQLCKSQATQLISSASPQQ
jgi:hypothetical protein